MKTIEIVGDESVLEKAKKYKIPRYAGVVESEGVFVKLVHPGPYRETTELPVQERETRSEPEEWGTGHYRRRRNGW